MPGGKKKLSQCGVPTISIHHAGWEEERQHHEHSPRQQLKQVVAVVQVFAALVHLELRAHKC